MRYTFPRSRVGTPPPLVGGVGSGLVTAESTWSAAVVGGRIEGFWPGAEKAPETVHRAPAVLLVKAATLRLLHR